MLRQLKIMNALNLFWTYFITYMLVILLPIISITIGAYQFTVSTLESELSQATLHSSKQKNAAVEKLLLEIQSIAVRIGLDGRLYSWGNNPDNRYLQNDIKDMLKTSATTHEAIQSIDLYMKAGNQILASDGYTRTFTESGRDVWVSKGLESKESGIWLGSRQIDDSDLDHIITYVMKVPLINQEVQGVVAIHIHESVIRHLLSNMEGNPHTNTYIMDQEGAVVTKHIQAGEESSINPIVQASQFEHEEPGSFIAKLGDSKHLITYAGTLHNHWTLVSETPLQYLVQTLVYIRSVAWSTCAVLVLLGILLSYFLSRKMYNPIKVLIDKAQSYHRREQENPARAGKKNELETISHILDQVFSKNDSWEQQFRLYSPTLRERFLIALLNNKHSSIHELERKLEFMQIEFPFNGYLVMILEIDEYSLLVDTYPVSDQNLFKFAMLNISEELASAKYKCLAAEAEDNQIVLLLNLEVNEDRQDKLKQDLSWLAQEMKASIFRLLKISTTIGIGRPYTQILQSHYSNKEAQEVLKTKMVAGTNTVLFFEDMAAASDSSYSFPEVMQQHLINHLKTGQIEPVLDQLEQLRAQIKAGKNPDQEHIFRIYSRVLDDILRTLQDASFSIQQVFGSDHNLFRDLAAKETVDSIHEWICEIVQKINDEQKRQPKNNKYIETVLSYVDSNYHLDLSLESIAEHVHLNHAYLSRIFKQETGRTIMEHLTIKRLEESKLLLKQTDQTIHEISTAVGYNNVNSFIRFFKRYEGVTPGDYRKTSM